MCCSSENEDMVKELTAAMVGKMSPDMSDPVLMETAVVLLLQGAGMEPTVSIVENDVIALGVACSKPTRNR